MNDHNELAHAGESERYYGLFSGHRANGRWWFRIFGWGVRYKDTRRHLPSYDERINQVRNLKIGPHWFRFLRP